MPSDINDVEPDDAVGYQLDDDTVVCLRCADEESIDPADGDPVDGETDLTCDVCGLWLPQVADESDRAVLFADHDDDEPELAVTAAPADPSAADGYHEWDADDDLDDSSAADAPVTLAHDFDAYLTGGQYHDLAEIGSAQLPDDLNDDLEEGELGDVGEFDDGRDELDELFGDFDDEDEDDGDGDDMGGFELPGLDQSGLADLLD